MEIKQELERFQRVNSCETIAEIKQCILDFADEHGFIQGRSRIFSAEKMASYVDGIYNGDYPSNLITREYGLRQQLLYLIHYKL